MSTIMLVALKRITIFLVIPLWMSVGADKELPVGGHLDLACSLDAPDSWDLQQLGASVINVVEYKRSRLNYACIGLFASTVGGTVCRDGVTIDTSSGKAITIASVDYSDAGTYTCRGDDLSEPTNLIVVQNDGPTVDYQLKNAEPNAPPQNPNHEVTQGNVITFTCSIRFAGAKSPAMQLVYHDFSGNERSLATSVSSTVAFSSNQVASVTADYTVPKTERDFTIMCHLPSNPSLMKSMHFTTIYGPIPIPSTTKNIVVVLSGGQAVLNCSVDCYPTATYIWFRDTNTSITGSSDTNIVKSAGNYRCVATNPRTNTQATMSFVVQATPTTTSTTRVIPATKPPTGSSPVTLSLHVCFHILVFAAAVLQLLE